MSRRGRGQGRADVRLTWSIWRQDPAPPRRAVDAQVSTRRRWLGVGHRAMVGDGRRRWATQVADHAYDHHQAAGARKQATEFTVQ